MTEPMNEQKKRSAEAPSAWKARQARQRIWRIIKTFIGMIFLGGLVGLGIVYKDQILALFEKKKPIEVAKATPAPHAPIVKPPEKIVEPEPPKITSPTPEPIKPTAITTTTEIVPSGEEDAAIKLIKDGCAVMEQFKFDDALTIFNQAALKKAGARLRAEAKTWANKAIQFKLATRHIPISDYAIAETSYIIKMLDGSEFEGLKVDENNEVIKLQCVPRENPAVLGTMKFPLPINQIQRQIPVSLSQRQQQFRQLLSVLENGLVAQNSADYYNVVYLSRRLNLGRECIEYLNRGYDGSAGREPDHDIGNNFRMEVVRRAIERAALMVAGGRSDIVVQSVLNDLRKTLPDFEPALNEIEAFKLAVKTTVKAGFKPTLMIKDVKSSVVATASNTSQGQPASIKSAKEIAREAADGEQIEVVVVNTGVTGHGAAATIVEKANAKYDEGMATYRRFRQGATGNNNQILRAALKLLEEAVDLYEEALKKEPHNQALISRQTEANMVAYGCKKYQTL